MITLTNDGVDPAENTIGWSANILLDTQLTHHAARYTATYDNAEFLDKINMMYPVAATRC